MCWGRGLAGAWAGAAIHLTSCTRVGFMVCGLWTFSFYIAAAWSWDKLPAPACTHSSLVGLHLSTWVALKYLSFWVSKISVLWSCLCFPLSCRPFTKKTKAQSLLLFLMARRLVLLTFERPRSTARAVLIPACKQADLWDLEKQHTWWEGAFQGKECFKGFTW